MPGNRIRKAAASPIATAKPALHETDVTTFAAYQQIVEQTDEKKQRIVSLLGLVGEVGDLHSMIKKLLLQRDHPTFRTEMREEFGDLLWYLTSLASLYKIPLEEIAQANAKKAAALYLEGSVPQFDRNFPEDERLPRRFRVTFIEKPIERGVHVKITVNGVTIGDALTDNAHEDDGYRFHDVFHFAYARARLVACRPRTAATEAQEQAEDRRSGGRSARSDRRRGGLDLYIQPSGRAWVVSRVIFN